MVYEEKSWRLCHELTEQGKEVWQQMLEAEADRILWKHQHPVKAAVGWLKEKLRQQDILEM